MSYLFLFFVYFVEVRTNERANEREVVCQFEIEFLKVEKYEEESIQYKACNGYSLLSSTW